MLRPGGQGEQAEWLKQASREELEGMDAWHRASLRSIEEALFNARLQQQLRELLGRVGVAGATPHTPAQTPAAADIPSFHHLLSPRDDTPPPVGRTTGGAGGGASPSPRPPSPELVQLTKMLMLGGMGKKEG
mmetsp:Transcript_18191/g.58827  ORF Transcript_18191/g.58827 Transcript_18191/m.58827 type:complete len:132 (-) Transcript_18191:20-415(-)